MDHNHSYSNVHFYSLNTGKRKPMECCGLRVAGYMFFWTTNLKRGMKLWRLELPLACRQKPVTRNSEPVTLNYGSQSLIYNVHFSSLNTGKRKPMECCGLRVAGYAFFLTMNLKRDIKLWRLELPLACRQKPVTRNSEPVTLNYGSQPVK